jgi:FlaA1/EpsC-like NDP-sugar epimerase
MANFPLRVSRPLLYRRTLIVAVHIALIPLAYLAAFELRFDFRIPGPEYAHFSATVWYMLAIRLIVFQAFGLYRGYWKHVGLKDLLDLSAAVTLSSILFATALPLLDLMTGMPRSVFLLDWVVMIFFSGGIRFAARALRESQMARSRLDDGRRTLIIGAGEGGEQLLRQLLHDPRAGMYVVGFVDDKPETHGRTLHGVPVLGHTGRLRELVARHQVELLVIAIRGAAAEQTRRIVEGCRETGIEFKIIPSLDDLLAGRATIGQLRDVEIDDLLGREPVTLNLEQIKRDLAGKSILVTGGAGSIGSELARQIASYGPARLVLLERAENALYFTQLEVAKAHPEVEVVAFIGSITNPDRLEEMFQLYRPNYVFHAAAYKHVPMLESNVTEAVWNNVFGTLRVAECAALHGVEKFVLISTDKAVNPTSVLGATKRIGERIVLELPSLCAAATDFRAVRFGNVLGSDGSVVPLFKRQISAGGPVKVTHPDVTRYFMTIPEAVALVLEAAALPEAARRISILEMGKPVRILELAEQLIRLSGLEPYRDIQITFTGLRPGEKLAEELVASAEDTVATSVDKIRVIERNGADGPAVERHLEHLLEILAHGSRDTLIAAISRLVPEYVPWQTRERPLLVPARPRATPEPRTPVRPAYARSSGPDGAPKSATA